MPTLRPVRLSETDHDRLLAFLQRGNANIRTLKRAQVLLQLDASLYEVYPPAEARRIASRFEVHYTPKHGSWLNMAEIEIRVFERGCLARPVADFETLDRRVKTLEAKRNTARCTIHWLFTSQNARTKLVDLYPVKET